MRGVGYESRQAPIVERDGAVPEVVQHALARVTVGPGEAEFTKSAHLLRLFVAETCAALAESRAQVLADRAELDGWRNRYRSEERAS